VSKTLFIVNKVYNFDVKTTVLIGIVETRHSVVHDWASHRLGLQKDNLMRCERSLDLIMHTVGSLNLSAVL